MLFAHVMRIFLFFLVFSGEEPCFLHSLLLPGESLGFVAISGNTLRGMPQRSKSLKNRSMHMAVLLMSSLLLGLCSLPFSLLSVLCFLVFSCCCRSCLLSQRNGGLVLNWIPRSF